uniref:L-serine deaminase n=1 Tax=Pristionchus pacificus TaxID=54126 RepID=A0A8R1UG80_PRIPA
MTLPSIDKETYSSFTLHSAVVMVKGKNGNGIERKRTTSDARDGVEYNRKVRKLQDEAAEIEKKAEEDETKKIEEKKDGEEDFADEFIPDPDCNPDIPRQVTFSDISAAAFNIKKGISKTPCTKSLQLSNKYGVELYFKKEYMQVTGSFKERGARFALSRLTAEEKKNGVIAASAGNHALALCYHGNLMGVAVTVVMPVFAPLMKITMCRSYGATVLLKGNNIGKAKDYAMHISREKKLKYINGYDAPDILAGQGTIGLEILEQVSDADAVLVPVGGGGMIAGVAVALKTLKPGILVYGIEAETCPSFTRAYEAGHVITEMAGSTLADGLAVPTVGCNSLATARGLIDKMITVCEESIALSILRLLELEKAVVEGAGGVCLAAILSDKVPELRGKKVVAILSGGNIDTTVLGRAIERGLAVDGRLIRIEVVVSDRPGGIAELSTRIAQAGGSIKDIFHERAWISTDVFSVRVKVVAETRDKEHVLELEKTLKERYTDVRIS